MSGPALCLVNNEHNKSHDVVSAFSRLVELKLEGIDNLKELCNGTLPYDFLESLKRLSIERCAHLQGILFKSNVNLCNLKSVNLFDCQELTSLFQLSTALSLVLLEELRIRECKLLTNIVEDENDHKSNGLIFPKLATLEIEGCEQLECNFPVALPRMQNIKISKCPKLKHIFYEEQGDIKISRLQKVELSNVSHLFNISIECYPFLASRVKRSSPRIDFKAKKLDPNKDRRHKLRSASKTKFPVEGGLTEVPMSSISSSECPPKQSQGLNMLVVHNIKQLVLKDLDKIKYLFTLSTASSMILEILIIDSCHELKHIIDIGDSPGRKNFEVVFLKLNELSVSTCCQLECMFGEYLLDDQNYNEIHIHLPALKKLNLQELPKFSLSSMTWTSLKEFVLVQCPNFIINPISDMMIHFDSRKLVSTTIEDIREMDKHFLTLETLNIKGYEAESIFCLSGLQIIGQLRLGLQCLKLSNLPRMSSICVGSRSSFMFPNLKTIQTIRCLCIKVIFPASVLSYLPELEILEIQDCEELEQIIEEDKKVGNVDSPQPCFPKLAKLVVKKCIELKRLISASSVLSYLPDLKVLEIEECMILEQIIEEDKKLGNVNSPQPCFPNLAVLVVKQCFKLKHLIPASDVPSVKTIRIVQCYHLEVMFPRSVLICLPELEVLEIEECMNLEHIIEEDKKVGNVDSPQPCFPKLAKLVVKKCIELKRLISASSVLSYLPVLKVLEIEECMILEQIIEEDKKLGNVDSPQPCFPNLAVLVVKQCFELKRLIPASDVPSVKTIRIVQCYHLEVMFPRSVLICLPELEVLEIEECMNLEQIIEEDKKLGNVDSPQPCFPNLAVLVVKQCFELKRLIPAYDVPNVKTIRIVQCYHLEVMFPRSVLICLPELEVLEIEECKNLEQIIEEDKNLGNVDSPQPCFPKLTVLLVKKCRNLKHVILASDIPNVKTIRIVGCFKVEVIFPHSVLSCLPELEVLEIEECMYLEQIIEEDKKLGNVDSPQPCFPNLAVLVVKQCFDLKRLIPASDVPNVKTIRIVQCYDLEVIFPRSVLSCLPELEVLEIEECMHLKQIIEEDKNLGNVDSPQPCFPKLAVLVVKRCRNLTRLFSAPNDVPNLELLIIILASKIEELMVGGEQRQGDDVSIGKMKVELPKLKLLIFGELPEATFKEGIELQTVRHRFVHKCPKLSLKATATFKEIEDKVLELFRMDLQKLLYQGEYDMVQGDEIVQSDVAQTVSGSDLHSSQINEESKKEFVGEVFDSKILAKRTTSTSLTEVQWIEMPSSSLLDIPTHLHELVDGQSISEPYLMNQQKPVNDTESTIDIPQSEIRLNQSETNTDKENEGHAMNIQDFKDDDLISLFQSVEEDGDGQIPPPSVSFITEDKLVVDVLADLEKSLKMPLKDIASSEANTLHCLKALNFLSHLPLEDETLSDGLKAIIESLHQEFLNILHSFKKAFATINNFAVLEEKEKSIKEELARQNGIAISLVSKISKAKNYMEDAQQKKAILKEQIIVLEKEIQDLNEMVDGRSMSESCLINQQKPLGETEITIEIPQCLKEKKDQSIQEGSEIENTIINRHVEEGTTSNNAMVETSLTHAESASSQFSTLVTSQPKPNPHSEIELKQIFADLEESLMMPLNDIASSEGNSLRLLKALNFLSHLPLEDITLSDGCKAIIDSLRHEFPSILCSFKQAFAITNKFSVLGPRLNEVTTMLVSKISKAKNFMGESQQKEETFKEEIIRLEKATTDVPVVPKAQTKSRIDLPSSQISEESKMELVGKVPDSEIPATTTSPTYLKWIERPSSSPLDNTLHKTHLHELVDGRRMNESCLMNQQKSTGETECTTGIPQCFQKPEHQSIQECSKSEKTVTTTGSSYSKTRSTLAGPSLVPFQMSIERGVEEGTTSDDAKILTLSTNSETASSQSGPLVTTDSKSYPHREIKLSQNEISTDKVSEGQIHTPSVSDVIADNSFVKILADLEESLKMPLKDIACTEANNNPLLVGLSFLSHLPLEDVTLSDALEVNIVSMHKELPTILFSFKQVFATINKVAVLKPHLNEVAIELVSRISKIKNCIDEARKKEATLKEHMILLEKEIKHCEDGLPSLEEEKKKCIAETIGYKKEYENVKKDKSKMLEDQRKARKELFEVDYRWSDLCSQFQLNRFAARNPS